MRSYFSLPVSSSYLDPPFYQEEDHLQVSASAGICQAAGMSYHAHARRRHCDTRAVPQNDHLNMIDVLDQKTLH